LPQHFDIGTRDGATTAPDFAAAALEYLKRRGYDATLNEHFKGAESMRKHGDPSAGIHSLQIEINRSIYMDEDSYRRGKRFVEIQNDLTGLAQYLVNFVRVKAR
jgi:N-formylglutamate amidohydrolase